MPALPQEPLHRAIGYALRLHAAVQRGDAISLAREQTTLTNLCLDVPDGDPAAGFRGARYALVCWLDELFICYSRWADRWNERKLESALYDGNDRAWEFWRQARQAAAQPNDEALRAYFLCVALGFRGKLRHDPAALEEWFAQTRARISRGPQLSAPAVAPRGRRAAARPLRGEARLARFTAVAAVVTVSLTPLLTFALMQRAFP